MGQIIFSRNPVGSVGLGLFLLGIAVFVYSVFDPTFGYVAGPCIAGGAVVAVLLGRRRPHDAAYRSTKRGRGHRRLSTYRAEVASLRRHDVRCERRLRPRALDAVWGRPESGVRR
jgi:hypothetical protein